MKIVSKILGLFLLIFTLMSKGQNVGNEWINHSQKYLRFPVTSTDLYKIPYETLEAGFSQMGMSIQDLNPKGLKIYGRGQELAIYIKGEEKGFLTNGVTKIKRWLMLLLAVSLNILTNQKHMIILPMV